MLDLIAPNVLLFLGTTSMHLLHKQEYEYIGYHYELSFCLQLRKWSTSSNTPAHAANGCKVFLLMMSSSANTKEVRYLARTRTL